jgi:hypothetical protein
MICRRTGVTAVFALLGLAGWVTAASSGPLNYQKTALSGQEIYIFMDSNLNADCSSAGRDIVKAVAGPNHGTVRLVGGKVYPHYSKGNDRYKCKLRKDDGIKGFYRSKPGYKGHDQITFSIHTYTGNVHSATVNINVE